MGLYRVSYCSRNLLTGSPASVASEIERILARSRANNARDGVTGGLLFTDGCFAQILEGTTEAVEAAFERIQCDERHAGVTVLETGPITARAFPDWSMAFSGSHSPSKPHDPGGTNDFTGLGDAAGRLLDALTVVVRREHEWVGRSRHPRDRQQRDSFRQDLASAQQIAGEAAEMPA